MSKRNIQTIASYVHMAMRRHSPEIFTGLGIVGMATTTVMAVRATPKALSLMEEEQDRRLRRLKHDENVVSFPHLEPLSKKEIFVLVWRCYLPSIITGTLSVVCLIGANSINTRRNAALATAYTLSESALKVYKDKVIETIGEKKEQTIHDAIAKDKIEQNPVNTKEIIITCNGNTLCYDALSGRYFKSDIEKLKQAVNELNRQMLDETYISLNDVYYGFGLDNIKLGEDIGWNVNKGFIDLQFSSQLASDGTPCLVIDYQVQPRADYCEY